MTIFEEIPTLSPVQFFALSWECPYVKGSLPQTSDHRLPLTAEMLDEEAFAHVFLGWNEQGIEALVKVKGRTQQDSVELFFDTRDLKTKAHVSKFCHHFVFTPDANKGCFGREITRFRGEDVHPLSAPEDLDVNVTGDDRSYAMQIQIPSNCLFGYDPIQFQRIGFTYRINRDKLPSQHFAVSSEEFEIEQQPSLWATLKLVRQK